MDIRVIAGIVLACLLSLALFVIAVRLIEGS